MKSNKTVVGLIHKEDKPVACIIQDPENGNIPTFYSIEKMNLDDVVDLLDNKNVLPKKKSQLIDPDKA